MLCEGIFLFLYLNYVFYNGFFTKWYFYIGLGWGKLHINLLSNFIFYFCVCVSVYLCECVYMCVCMCVCVNYDEYFVHSGLPVPIVAIAAGVAYEHYGSEHRLVN